MYPEDKDEFGDGLKPSDMSHIESRETPAFINSACVITENLQLRHVINTLSDIIDTTLTEVNKLGAVYDPDEDEVIITEEDEDGEEVDITIDRDDPAAWAIISLYRLRAYIDISREENEKDDA